MLDENALYKNTTRHFKGKAIDAPISRPS